MTSQEVLIFFEIFKFACILGIVNPPFSEVCVLCRGGKKFASSHTSSPSSTSVHSNQTEKGHKSKCLLLKWHLKGGTYQELKCIKIINV